MAEWKRRPVKVGETKRSKTKRTAAHDEADDDDDDDDEDDDDEALLTHLNLTHRTSPKR